MPDNIEAEATELEAGRTEATCVHTRKIFDSCQAKDCVEDLRLYPTASGQKAINEALSVRSGRAELLYVYIEVQPVGMGRGFYAVDMRFYYRMSMEVNCGCSRPALVDGLAVFDKRAVLFGSEATSKTFSSRGAGQRVRLSTLDFDGSLPVAVCEAVDPIVLATRLADAAERPEAGELPLAEVPAGILSAFDEEIVFENGPGKRIYFTLGQFSILRLERDAHLLMPVYDYCMPDKECCCSEKNEDDPCEVFQRVDFPVGDFFPPSNASGIDPITRLRTNCC
ncbi:MAG: hypothetical protein LUD78_00730 [Clostridiales bacterium]|nr:hypothetical protein [Clostridiales bacterium]